MQELPDIHLNAFQTRALYRILGSRFGLVQLPTGCGKTRLAAAAIRLFRDRGLLCEGDVVLVLSPRLVIREQIYREFHSILGKGFRIEELSSSDDLRFHHALGLGIAVLVVTPQLIVSSYRQDQLQGIKVRGVVLDEVHHTYTGDVTSDVVKKLVDQAIAGGGFALGLTATPTSEALELLGNNLLYSALSADAMAAGVLIDRLTIKYAETRFGASNLDPWKYAVPQRAAVYARKILEALGYEVSKKVLVVAPNVDEADWMRDALIGMFERINKGEEGKLVRVAHYRVAESLEEVRWFREADRGILIAVNMADIGFDVPDLEVLVLARKFSSPVAYTQVRGRVLRKPPHTDAGRRKSDNGAILIDLVGSSMKHEPVVPLVETGNLHERYEVFSRELRGIPTVERRNIETMVSEFHEEVLDAETLRALEESVVRALLKKPRKLDELMNLRPAGVKASRVMVSLVCTILEQDGIIVEDSLIRLSIPSPLTAIVWLALREGVETGDEGWMRVSRNRAEALIEDPAELDRLLNQSNRLLRRSGSDSVEVCTKGWREILALEQKLADLQRSFANSIDDFQHKLEYVRKQIRRYLNRPADGVDLHFKVPSGVLLDDKLWNAHAGGILAAVSKRLLSGTNIVISVVVYGHPPEVGLIARRVGEALSSTINAGVRVSPLGQQWLWRSRLDDAEKTFSDLLKMCREGLGTLYDSQYRQLMEKIQKKLEEINELNIGILKVDMLVYRTSAVR